MALGEPQAEDTQHHSRDIVALASLGQAWTLPVELGGHRDNPPRLQQVLVPGTRDSCASLLAPAPWNALRSPEHVLSQEYLRCQSSSVCCEGGGSSAKTGARGTGQSQGCAKKLHHWGSIHEHNPTCCWPCPSPWVRSCHSVQTWGPATLPKANPLN